MKAEIARELGKFEESLHLLNYKFGKQFTDMVELIKQLCREKKAVVTLIK